MKAFLLKLPQSDEILALYYALQENEIPCVIVRHETDPNLIKVTVSQLPSNPFDMACHIERIKGFVMGWRACYNREALPDDRSLQATPGVIGR